MVYIVQDSCDPSRVNETRTQARLDAMDQKIVAALQADPRASWAQLGSSVGVSETTVLRRVQRLRETGALVVVAAPDALLCGFGQPVLLEFRTAPGQATALAEKLAMRADVRFVALLTGRSDVMCELIVPDRRYLTRVLNHEIPAYGSVMGTTTHVVLKTFKTGDQWSRGLLDADGGSTEQQEVRGSAENPARLDEMDMRLLAALGHDGRRSYADLSHELGLSETAIGRRVVALTSSRRLYFVAMVEPTTLGFEVEVLVHLRVEHGHLEDVATNLASLSPVRYVSATTGFSDLVFEAIFRDNAALYEFLTETLQELDGVREIEVDVVLESVKRAFRYPLFVPEEERASVTSTAPAAQKQRRRTREQAATKSTSGKQTTKRTSTKQSPPD
jgi:DNA-binding Lrp family transcriptional regulator